jgi:hypothetical protein
MNESVVNRTDEKHVYFNQGERIERFQVTGRCFDSGFGEVDLDCEGYLSFTVKIVDSPVGGMPFYCQAVVEVLPNNNPYRIGSYWRGYTWINPPKKARFIRWVEGKSPGDLTDKQRRIAGMQFSPYIREML